MYKLEHELLCAFTFIDNWKAQQDLYSLRQHEVYSLDAWLTFFLFGHSNSNISEHFASVECTTCHLKNCSG